MKKTLGLLILSFCFQLPLVWAQKPLAQGTAPTLQPLQVGIVAAVKGTVQAEKSGQVGKVLSSGEPVFLGDVIVTDSQSRLQILLQDETVFTVGPESRITIDEFVYDPATGDGKVNANAVKGVFRLVTGKIARKKPENVKVKLPTGTIGIRGTIVLLDAQPTESLAVLYGPGENNNTGTGQGSFILGPDDAGSEQDFEDRGTKVDDTGSGATIDEFGNISDEFEVPQDRLDQLNNSLAPQDDDEGGGQKSNKSGTGGGGDDEGDDGEGEGEDDGESATEQAGQDDVDGDEGLDEADDLFDGLEDLDSELDDAAQDAADEDLGTIEDGPTLVDELLAEAEQNMGVFNYSQTDVPLTGAGNPKYDFKITLDFGNREIGGGMHDDLTIKDDFLVNSGSGSTSFSIFSDPIDFEDSEDEDFAEYVFVDSFSGGNCSPTACDVQFTIALENEDGQVADVAVHDLLVVDTNLVAVDEEGGDEAFLAEGATV